MPRTQYVIVSRDPESGNGGTMPSLGSRDDVVRKLRDFNTAPEQDGDDDVLYGPGICVQMPPMQDPVTQMLLSLTEEEIAWPVIIRIGKALDWKIIDAATGRELNP